MDKKKKKKKKSKWIKKRHSFFRLLLYPFIGILSKIKFHIKVEKCKDKRQFLIISNHQTTFDQFFVGLAFKKHLYYVTNDDIFSNGFVSKLINFLVKPIPIKKGTADVKAVMDCMRVAKEGGSIAIFPEGNRTYSGRTGAIKDTIAPFAKALKLPIAIFHIRGGYGVQPRWSDGTRKGKMTAGVSEIIEYEQYKNMLDSELYSLICKKLYIDECQVDGEYPSKKSAEYLERAMYYCPTCGGFGAWKSHGEISKCHKCATEIKYLPTKEIEGVGSPFPYRFIGEWYDAQNAFLRSIDISKYIDTPLFSDTVDFLEVIPCKKKIDIASAAKISAYGDRFEIEYGGEKEVFSFSEITASGVLGRNKMNFYTRKRILQIRYDEHFNALKYVNVYYHAENTLKGDTENGFIGI